jgi:hypothetical protein
LRIAFFSIFVFISSRRGRQNGFYEYEDPSHGFQGDMTAEEIFNMFFGGGMPGSSGEIPPFYLRIRPIFFSLSLPF